MTSLEGVPWSRNIALDVGVATAQDILATKTGWSPMLETVRITAVNPAAAARVSLTIDFYDGTTATVIHVFQIDAGTATADVVTRDQAVFRAPAPQQRSPVSPAVELHYKIRATLSAATTTSVQVYLAGQWFSNTTGVGTHSATA